MKTTVGQVLIEKWTKFFSLYGLPTKIVSDNGPPFNSAMFKRYCESNGIIFQNSPPYHAQSNGLAERGVQTAKKALIRFYMGKESDLSLQEKIDKYLMCVRNSPSFETGRSPAEIVFSYKPKMKLDLVNENVLISSRIKSNFENKTTNVQLESRSNTMSNVQEKFKVGDRVYYRCHFKNWVKWIPATVKQKVSTLTYLILVNGLIRFVQENQIRHPTESDKHCIVYKSTDTPHEEPFNDTLGVIDEDIEMRTISSGTSSI